MINVDLRVSRNTNEIKTNSNYGESSMKKLLLKCSYQFTENVFQKKGSMCVYYRISSTINFGNSISNELGNCCKCLAWIYQGICHVAKIRATHILTFSTDCLQNKCKNHKIVVAMCYQRSCSSISDIASIKHSIAISPISKNFFYYNKQIL